MIRTQVPGTFLGFRTNMTVGTRYVVSCRKKKLAQEPEVCFFRFYMPNHATPLPLPARQRLKASIQQTIFGDGPAHGTAVEGVVLAVSRNPRAVGKFLRRQFPF